MRASPLAVVFLALLVGCSPGAAPSTDTAPADTASAVPAPAGAGPSAAARSGATPSARALAPWSWEIPACPAYRRADYAAPQHRVSIRVADDGTVTEIYESGWGSRAFAEIREVVRVCGEYEPAVAEYREQHRVVATGFAPGDESLLVRTVRLAPHTAVRTWYTIVVREGDAVVTARARDCLPLVTDATCVDAQA